MLHGNFDLCNLSSPCFSMKPAQGIMEFNLRKAFRMQCLMLKSFLTPSPDQCSSGTGSRGIKVTNIFA